MVPHYKNLRFMCILIIKSTNPLFSFVINKHPDSPMQIKPNRKGYLFGYYKLNTASEYVIYFKDADNRVSYLEYANQEYEYLTNLKFSSPIFVINAISEFFGRVADLKATETDADGYDNIIMINLIHMVPQTNRLIRKLEKFFPDVSIDLTYVVADNYKVNISTKKYLGYLFNFCVMYAGLVSCFNATYPDLTEQFLDKVVEAINACQAPYYIRYIFASRSLLSTKMFYKFKPALEQNMCTMFYGNTATQRSTYIKSLLKFDQDIIDIGCGEGTYAIEFARILAPKKFTYHAVDIDDAQLKKIKKKASKKHLYNILTYSAHHQLCTTERANVIISEVIEHTDKDTASSLIRFVLDHINFTKIIITTPNVEFNQHYKLNLRHSDHKWELDKKQFIAYISDITRTYTGVEAIYTDIGDRINNISLTQGVILTKSEPR